MNEQDQRAFRDALADNMKQERSEDEIILERIKLNFTNSFTSEQLIAAEALFAQTDRDFMQNTFTAIVRGYLYGEPGPVKIISYPADWVQAFKQRWFPAWAQRRWPVRLITTTINMMTLYPEFRISMPRHPHVLKYSVRESEILEPQKRGGGIVVADTNVTLFRFKDGPDYDSAQSLHIELQDKHGWPETPARHVMLVREDLVEEFKTELANRGVDPVEERAMQCRCGRRLLDEQCTGCDKEPSKCFCSPYVPALDDDPTWKDKRSPL